MNLLTWSISLALLSVPALAQLQTLAYRPVDSIYSTPLDRLIMVSENPSLLHLYDPVSRGETTVALPYAPISVALSPDGLYAAVGHDQWVSWVDLRNASVVRTLNLGLSVPRLAVTQEYIYGVGGPSVTSGGIGGFRYVPVAGGPSSAVSASIVNGSAPPDRLLAARGGASIYTTGRFLRLDVGEAGALTAALIPLRSWPSCGGYFPIDAERILAGCGSLLSLSETPATDLELLGTLGTLPLLSAASSPVRNEAAIIRLDRRFGIGEPEVELYSTASRTPTGRFRLPTFPLTGNAVAVGAGRLVAYTADSSQLVVVEQTDPFANQVTDFGVAVFSRRSDCPVSYFADQNTASATGGRGAVRVTTSGDCLWQATTTAPWLLLPAGDSGAAQTSLEWYASPNPTGAARSADIVIGGQTWTVTQEAEKAPSAFTALPFVPIASEYSRQLDRLVMISTSPNQLHVWDAAARTETLAVDLPRAPQALSVSPDGQFAGIGLEGQVLRISLADGTVDRRIDIPVSYRPGGLTLGSSWAWYFGDGLTPRAIDLAFSSSGGAQTWARVLAPFYRARLSIDGASLFPPTFVSTRIRLSEGLPSSVGFGTEPSCDGQWPAVDSLRLFTGCGTVLRLADGTRDDLTLMGTLHTPVRALAQAPALGSVFALPGEPLKAPMAATEIRRYSSASLAEQGALPLPMIASATGAMVQSHGLDIFASGSEEQLHLIVQTDPAASPTPTYGIYTVPIPPPMTCEYSVSPPVISKGSAATFAVVTVNTSPVCSWQATRDELTSWISIRNGAGRGPGQFVVTLDNNLTGGARTGTVQVNGQTVTISQEDSSGCELRLPSEVTVHALSPSFRIVPEAPSTCAFPVRLPSGSFLNLAGVTSATGNSTTLTVFSTLNTTGAERTSEVLIGPASVKVTQLADGGPAACIPSFSTSGANLTAAGGTASATLSFTGTCPATWDLAFLPTWITLEPVSGSTTGTQSLAFSVSPNGSASTRVGMLLLRGMPGIIVAQQAAASTAASSISGDSRYP